MARQSLIELTNMCIIFDNKRILVEEKVYGNTKGIIFPGGHVEEGESIHDSVVREIKEETGLTISNPKLCGIKDWIQPDGTRYLVLLYKCNSFSGEISSSSEGKIFWVDIQNIHSMQLIWNAEEIMEIVLDEKYSELFFKTENGETKMQLFK